MNSNIKNNKYNVSIKTLTLHCRTFTIFPRLAPGLRINIFKLLVCVNWSFFDDSIHFFMAIQYSFHKLCEDWGCPGSMFAVYY